MQQTSRITIKGQVTIPKTLRTKLNLKAGDQVLFISKGEDVILKPAKTLLDLRGSIKTGKGPEKWDNLRKSAKEYVTKEVLNQS